MEYGKIIAVTGLPGLYELLTSKSDGAIVRSLDDKTTKFVSSRVHNFSHLESIEVFAVRENVNLSEVFHAMEENKDSMPDGKDGNELKKYFEKVYPDLDFERVYTSDLKKMVKWFSVLKDNDVEIKLRPADEEIEPEGEKIEEPKEEEKPAPIEEPKKEVIVPKKTAVKKKAAAKAEVTEKPQTKAKEKAKKEAKEKPKAAVKEKKKTEEKAVKKAAPKKKAKK